MDPAAVGVYSNTLLAPEYSSVDWHFSLCNLWGTISCLVFQTIMSPNRVVGDSEEYGDSTLTN